MSMSAIDYIKNLFKRDEKKEKIFIRSFKGASRTRYTKWIDSTLTKINSDIQSDLLTTITRCRDLAKNEPIIRSYLSMCEKNIIGKSGFSLQCQLKKDDNILDEELNNSIEWAWWEFGKTSNGFLTVDGGMGHNEFDSLILRTLLIDGEVFIRIHKNAKNPFGLSFEMIDAAAIDFTKQQEFNSNGVAIILGVEVDRKYKPLAYYVREGTVTAYTAGKIERVPANEIIHLYKREFPAQTRGIPPFNACLDSIKQLQDYRIAELMGAKTSACLGIFYERNNMTTSGDFLDQSMNEENNAGEFINSLEPGMASIAPTGYSVKSVTPTHPNSGYYEFNKSILTQMASSLGVSYAKLCKDYSAVNYSSLREGTIDEAAYFSAQQEFLINNWKEKEFELFIESYIVNGNTSLKPSRLKDILWYHQWVTVRRAYFDKGKDILAEKYAIEMGIKSPIMLLEEEGKDVDEVLKSYSLWNSLCKKYDLNFNSSKEDNLLNPEEDQSEEEQMNKDGRNG